MSEVGPISEAGARNREVCFIPGADRIANRRNVLFHNQDRTVRELYNPIGPAANQPIVER
jgi:hypothetical protein